MTTNRRAPVQMKITSRTAAVKFHGHTVFEGFPAFLIIVIILASKITWAITRLALAFLCWISPLAFRFALRQAAGLYLCFRAFYTE